MREKKNSEVVLWLKLVSPKRTLTFRISRLVFLTSLISMILSIIFLHNRIIDGVLFGFMCLSLFALWLKRHRFDGHVVVTKQVITINHRNKVISLPISGITEVRIDINEHEGEYNQNSFSLMNTLEGIHNYIDIHSHEYGRKTYEFFLTKSDFQQLNEAIGLLQKKLDRKLIISQKGEIVKHVSF